MIHAYEYDGTVQCVRCTRERYESGAFSVLTASGVGRDMHGLPEVMVDTAGNPVRPITDGDELMGVDQCAVCGIWF